MLQKWIFSHILWLSGGSLILTIAARMEAIFPPWVSTLSHWWWWEWGWKIVVWGEIVEERRGSCSWKSNTYTLWDSFKGSKYSCLRLSMASFPCPSWNISGCLSGFAQAPSLKPALEGSTQDSLMRCGSFISPPPWWGAPASHSSFSSWDQVLSRPHTQNSHPVMTENHNKIMAWSLLPEQEGNSPTVTNLRSPIPRSIGSLWSWDIKEIQRLVWLDESWENFMT